MKNKKNPKIKTPLANHFLSIAFTFQIKIFIPHPSLENKSHLLAVVAPIMM